MGCYRRGIRLSAGEPIKGFGSHQEKCLSSVIAASEVKTAVNSNDA